MKKLERINTEKFKVSEDELTNILGGYGSSGGGSTWDTSNNYYYTYQDNSTTMDSTVYDVCRDW